MNEEFKLKCVTYIIVIAMLCMTLLCMFHMDNNRYHQYDVNHDGKVNITDYAVIKNYILKD